MLRQANLIQGVFTMSSFDDKLDEAKSKGKETLGKVTGDKGKETEGKAEGLASKAKQKAEDVKDAAKGAAEGLKKSADKDKE